MAATLRVSARNASFQQWLALLSNRTKRQRAAEFLVQGVRPITLAVQHGWPIHALIHDADRPLSRWAAEMLERVDAPRYAMAPALLRELAEKDNDEVELIVVAGLPPDTLSRIPVGTRFLGAVFDRPSSPGNIGAVVRSVDAFGGGCVIVTGHAADPYDPRAVRASTGSLFAVPVVRVASHREVIEWIEGVRAGGVPLALIAADESARIDVAEQDLTRPSLIVIGNETTGLSAGWRECCDAMVRIPIAGSASSLNAANAATVLFYEAARQRARRV